MTEICNYCGKKHKKAPHEKECQVYGCRSKIKKCAFGFCPRHCKMHDGDGK